jgi:hypothetical protein
MLLEISIVAMFGLYALTQRSLQKRLMGTCQGNIMGYLLRVWGGPVGWG